MDQFITRFLIAILISIFLTGITWLAVNLRRLLYKIKLPGNRYKILTFLEFLQLRVAAENPGYEWAATEIDIGSEKKKIYYPVWHSWTIFHHPEIYDGLVVNFRNKFGDLIGKNTRICAMSQPAIFLLGKLDEWLQDRGATVFPYDEGHNIPEDWKTSKLILFDINLNSGKTIGKAVQQFNKLNWKPSHYLVILYNDFTPNHNELGAQDPSWQDNFSHIYKASTVVKGWKDQNLAQALIIVKDTLDNHKPWDDQKLTESLNLLQAKPVTVDY